MSERAAATLRQCFGVLELDSVSPGRTAAFVSAAPWPLSRLSAVTAWAFGACQHRMPDVSRSMSASFGGAPTKFRQRPRRVSSGEPCSCRGRARTHGDVRRADPGNRPTNPRSQVPVGSPVPFRQHVVAHTPSLTPHYERPNRSGWRYLRRSNDTDAEGQYAGPGRRPRSVEASR